MSKEKTNIYYKFLMQVLQAIAESNGDPDVVYPLLEQNLDKLDENLGYILKDWASKTLFNLPLQEADKVPAVILFTFSHLIAEFPLGNRSHNLEIAIIGYKSILGLYTREAFPYEWAMTQNNLGIVYSERIQGDKADNLELAIDAYTQALQVSTREAFPEDWAMTQNNLGNAYRERIKGDKADNLEQAIDAYKQALQVRTREAFPQDWAMTQNNLGLAYSERIKEDKADNLKQAIDACTEALKVYTREAFPYEWAMTQNNLGNAYSQRIEGDKADNLEQAIDAYKQALQVRTREAFPQDWAMTQNNLGLAYSERIKEDKADNLKQAIDACTEALKVYTREAFPYEWAMTQNNLGNAYSQRIEGDKADNLEQAIDAYTEALKVYTREAFPYEWARTQNNLGNAYSERIQGDKADNLQQAFNAYTAFQNALQVHTLKTFPLDCLQTSQNLGDLALKQENWLLAIEAYDLAIESIEITRNWARTDKRRQEILAESMGVYGNMIQACINQSHLEQKRGKLQQAQDLLEKALETSERSRCRQLADLFAVRDLYPDGNIPPEIEEYNQLQQQISNLRDRYSSDNTRQLTEAGTHSQTRAQFEAETEEIKRLEDEKKKIWEKIRSYDPVLAGQLQVDPLKIKDIQALITDEKTALLSFYSTDNDTYIFILRNVGEKLDKRSVNLHICKNQGIETLQNWIYDNWFTPYCNRKNSKLWRDNMTEFLAELSERLQLKSLVDEHLTGIEELIIVPHLSLHQMPFAALPIEPKPKTSELSDEINSPSSEFSQEETTRGLVIHRPTSQPQTPVKFAPKPSEYLGDRFRLRVVPSCQILNFCYQRDPISSVKMGIVENATGDLVFTEYECKILSKLYQVPDSQRLYYQNATFENYQNLIKNVQFIHSSHHASSRRDNPLNSQLTLYQGEVTLSHLLTWRLPELSDVFLSCCETHFTMTQITDDTLTLAAGFLCAGARSVVCTLWSVNDLSTALFCLFYYQNIQQNSTRSEALQKAQFQLRTLTGKQLKEQYKAELDNYLSKQQTEDNRDKITEHRDRLLSLCQKEFPFSSPYYWAGFVSQGLS